MTKRGNKLSSLIAGLTALNNFTHTFEGLNMRKEANAKG
jgi:hypothetical protein